MARCFAGACSSVRAGSAIRLGERSGAARFVLGVWLALGRVALLGVFTSAGEGVSFSDSVFSKAVWVNRLARWVGAGGNGMNEVLLRMEKKRQKTKSRLEAKAAFGVESRELGFSGMQTLCTSQKTILY